MKPIQVPIRDKECEVSRNKDGIYMERKTKNSGKECANSDWCDDVTIEFLSSFETLSHPSVIWCSS